MQRFHERLAEARPLPAALVTAASLDLIALGHAAASAVRGILTVADEVRAAGSSSAEDGAVIENARRFLQTRQAFLACSALLPEARNGTVAFELDGPAVRIVGLTAFDAEGLAHALVGEVGGFVLASTGVLAEAIAEPIRQLEAL